MITSLTAQEAPPSMGRTDISSFTKSEAPIGKNRHIEEGNGIVLQRTSTIDNSPFKIEADPLVTWFSLHVLPSSDEEG